MFFLFFPVCLGYSAGTHGYAVVYKVAGEWVDRYAPGGERGCGGGRECCMHCSKAGIGRDEVAGGGGRVVGEPVAYVRVQAGGRCVAHSQEGESSLVHNSVVFVDSITFVLYHTATCDIVSNVR